MSKGCEYEADVPYLSEKIANSKRIYSESAADHARVQNEHLVQNSPPSNRRLTCVT